MNSIDNSVGDPEQPVRNAFIFLVVHSRSPDAFSKEEFKNFVNYPNPDNFDTYFSKKLRHFLEEAPNNPDRFLVSGVFKKYSKWEKFKAYFSQSSKIKANYIEEYFRKLMIFEFFIPLTNENDLRSSLDEVFYKNTVELALNRIPQNELIKAFPKNDNESNLEYIERICGWISSKFGGYSIGSVRGRFKVSDIKTFAEVALIREKGEEYIIDETTAIVRFIFHIGDPISSQVSFGFENIEEELNEKSLSKEMMEEANQIRFIFKNLFVRSILDLVNGEDEIWMLESGIINHLYIWKNDNL
ncbi:MAG: hypothetical protein ACFFD7_05635 [Candidatus Thorarchaeota archaeon]